MKALLVSTKILFVSFLVSMLFLSNFFISQYVGESYGSLSLPTLKIDKKNYRCADLTDLPVITFNQFTGTSDTSKQKTFHYDLGRIMGICSVEVSWINPQSIKDFKISLSKHGTQFYQAYKSTLNNIKIPNHYELDTNVGRYVDIKTEGGSQDNSGISKIKFHVDMKNDQTYQDSPIDLKMKNDEPIQDSPIDLKMKNDEPIQDSTPDRIIYDYIPGTPNIKSDANVNEMINEMTDEIINNLLQERGGKSQNCGDGKDNDGDGKVDEQCDATSPPQEDKRPTAVEPEQEICGDEKDNDGDGKVDEQCDDTVPPQEDDKRPTAVEPEQEICGDEKDNDGDGKVDEQCDDTVPPQEDDDQSSKEKNKFDKFGILKIYQTKTKGEEWFMNSNPNEDPRFSPQTKLVKNSDGSFKVISSKVRLGVFTSSGYNPEKISTLNHNRIALKGYMQSPNDWRDVEMTGYVKFNTGSNDNFVWYARGGRHTGFGTPQGCEGSAYKADLYYDGTTRWVKEQWHVGGYVFGEYEKSFGSIKGKWVGFKAIMYNIDKDGKTSVKLELWVDKNNDNKWIKFKEMIDKGGWGNQGAECGGKPDQVITWGGPIATFRWDSALDVDIKNFSVREIVPS